jgi:hypothetical protein
MGKRTLTNTILQFPSMSFPEPSPPHSPAPRATLTTTASAGPATAASVTTNYPHTHTSKPGLRAFLCLEPKAHFRPRAWAGLGQAWGLGPGPAQESDGDLRVAFADRIVDGCKEVAVMEENDTVTAKPCLD